MTPVFCAAIPETSPKREHLSCGFTALRLTAPDIISQYCLNRPPLAGAKRKRRNTVTRVSIESYRATAYSAHSPIAWQWLTDLKEELNALPR